MYMGGVCYFPDKKKKNIHYLGAQWPEFYDSLFSFLCCASENIWKVEQI